MNGVRPLISARLDGDIIHITTEWVNVIDAVIQCPAVFTEEVRISRDRPGVSVLSRVVLPEGSVVPDAFWVDEQGLRHFVVQAEAGDIGMAGGELDAKKG